MITAKRAAAILLLMAGTIFCRGHEFTWKSQAPEPKPVNHEPHYQHHRHAEHTKIKMSDDKPLPFSTQSGYVYKQVLADKAYYSQRYFELKGDVDSAWTVPDAYDVRIRCRTINFTNGPFFSKQSTPPSTLPKSFHDTFYEASLKQRLWSWWDPNTTSAQTYSADFSQRMRDKSFTSQDAIKPYALAEMRRWSQYYFEGFREYIKTLPGYDDYMLEIAAQLQHDRAFALLVHHAEPIAVDHIKQESARITSERKAQAYRDTQAKTALALQKFSHDLFTAQDKALQSQLPRWEKDNPIRYQAYNQMIASNGAQSKQDYYLSDNAAALLKEASINPDAYAQLQGNALQHALMREIVDSIERVVEAPKPVEKGYQKLVCDATLEAFNEACTANKYGNYAGTVKLIDQGHVFLGYYLYIMHSAVAGMKGTVSRTAHALLHPVQAVNDLVRLLVTYGPPVPPDTDSIADWQKYYRKCEQTSKNRRAEATRLKERWQQLSTVDKVGAISGGIAGLVADTLTMNVAANFMSKVAYLAHNEIAKVGKAVLDKMPRQELLVTTPGYLLIQQTKPTARVIEIGRSCGLSEEVLIKTVTAIEKAGVDLAPLATKLEQNHERLKQLTDYVRHAKDQALLKGAALSAAQEEALIAEYMIKDGVLPSVPATLAPGTYRENLSATARLSATPVEKLLKDSQLKIALEGLNEAVIDERFLKHILEMEIITDVKSSGVIKKNVSGFHHDYKGELQSQGIIELRNKNVCPKTSAITADIWRNGELFKAKKTFFPESWSREKVLNTLIETITHPVQKKLEKGRWVIQGTTKEGMNIQIIVEPNGRLVTAYPLMQGI